MLFIHIHKHSTDKCLTGKSQELINIGNSVQEEAKKVGVKIIGVYAAPHQHTIFSIYEADDIAKLERVLTPMTLWGDSQLIPVVSMQLPTAGT